MFSSTDNWFFLISQIKDVFFSLSKKKEIEFNWLFTNLRIKRMIHDNQNYVYTGTWQSYLCAADLRCKLGKV